MKIPEEWLGESAQVRMIDAQERSTAPIALWACMSSLAGGAEPRAAMVQRRVQDGGTEWRALWMTDTALAFGSVLKGKEEWSAYSDSDGDDQPDLTSGWMRPIKTASRVELSGVQCRRVRNYGESNKVWIWSSTVRIVFDDDESVELPLFGEPTSDDMDADVQRFLKELAQRM